LKVCFSKSIEGNHVEVEAEAVRNAGL